MWKVTGRHEKNKIKMVYGHYGFGYTGSQIPGVDRTKLWVGHENVETNLGLWKVKEHPRMEKGLVIVRWLWG